jgi:hypothetical protein
VISREDLVVVLSSPAEGAFEPIASPDPGPLPVRALRVVQAQGEFTFSQGNTAPTQLVVTLRGDQKTFPMSQTLTPTKCLGKEPQKGDPFPGARKAIRGFSKLMLLRRPQCCVKDFDAPQNSATDATVKSEYFEIDADFAVRGRRCVCRCCEYRQFVRGAFRAAAGRVIPFPLPDGPLDVNEFQEDGVIDEFGRGEHGFYGRRDRDRQRDGDRYDMPDAEEGCRYRANDTPGCRPTETLRAEFLGLVVDTCQGEIRDVRNWVVAL